MNKYMLIFLCLSFSAVAQIKENKIESPVPASKIFSNQQYRSPRLSPDASYVAVFEYNDGSPRVGLIERKSDNFIPVADLGKGGQLINHFWLSANKLYLEVSVIAKERRIEATTIIEINVNDDGMPSLSPHQIRQPGYVLGRAHSASEKLVFAHKPPEGETRIFVTDPMALTQADWQGEDEIDGLIDESVFYFYDSPSDQLLSLSYDSEASTFSMQYRTLRGTQWHTLLEDFDTEYSFKPMGFIDENNLAVLSDISTDKIALYRYNIPTKTFGEVLYEHDSYDLLSAEVNYETGEPTSVTYYKGGELTVEYLNSVHNYRQSVLNANLNGRNAILVDYSAEADVYVVAAYAPDAPADLYVYDVQNKVASLLFSVQPELDEYRFSAAQLLTFESSSNQIESYFYPAVGEDNNTLLIMPHGGPIGVRDTADFNRVVQFYTTRGYAVLQVNFHGSFGFGKAFREGGVGEFGQQIERDIVQAISQLEQHHSFENRCAMGASYGGYSALMLSILHPDLVDCVVARFGIYDLPLVFNQSNVKTSEEWLKKVENTIGEYDENLFDISPLYLAEKIAKPLLLTAGYEDDVAAFEHTQRLDYVLTKLGIPFERAYYKHTGHGHSIWSGDQHEHVLIDDFIRRQLSIPPLPIQTVNKAQQKLLVEDLLLVANGFLRDNRVDKDEKRATYFYKQAATTGQPEALLQLALSQLSAKESVSSIPDTIALLKQAADLGNADAAYQLTYRYLFDYRFDAPQPLLAKKFLDKSIALEDSYRTTLLTQFWDCLWTKGGTKQCLSAMKSVPKAQDDRYQYLFKNIVAELVNRLEGDSDSIEVLMKEYANIAPSSTLIDKIESGLFSKLANGEEAFSSVEGLSLQPGDRIAIDYKLSTSNMFRAADQPLGVIIEWHGVKANGEVSILERTFFYNYPRYNPIVRKTRFHSSHILDTYNQQFTDIKVVLKDIYNKPQLSETFNLH